eukprot:7384890-Prymnesium_polylepis.2
MPPPPLTRAQDDQSARSRVVRTSGSLLYQQHRAPWQLVCGRCGQRVLVRECVSARCASARARVCVCVCVCLVSGGVVASVRRRGDAQSGSFASAHWLGQCV